MCRFYITILLILSSTVYANDEFNQWLQQEKGAFQEYKDKRDKEFTAFLKNQWKGVELLRGFKRDPSPKPAVIPVAQPPAERPPVTAKPEPKPVIKLPALPIVPSKEPVTRPTVPAQGKGIKINVNYFGTPLAFYYDSKLRVTTNRAIDEKVVSDFWSRLSLADYDNLIEQINSSSKALKLGDWSYILLVDGIARKIYPKEKNSQSLFSWFVLTKAGYQARIAYNRQNIYLLMPSRQQLYSVPYFTFHGARYYALSLDGEAQTLGEVYTYDGSYPDVNKILDLNFADEIAENSYLEKRDLSFEFEGKRYSITVDYSRSRIDFMNTYPQLDLEWYFRSRVNVVTSTSLQAQLSTYMKNMDEQTAVNFLLRFVQTALAYKTDESQFGKENYLFPEETLRYPYSDCEDRSILFAWLVHSMLGLEVVGIDYPGHVATAVKFNSNIAGDAIEYRGSRYVISDPTYINASTGMTMPAYKNTQPKVISIW